MPPINWSTLRPWGGSQNNAFEILCCQLAAGEQTPASSTFIRKAPPDAGLECFWKLPNGDEWGWQAKFFLAPPNPDQWGQIDESVKRALERHPYLTKNTICLPIDRQDPRIAEQQWFMDRWGQHAAKWQAWAQTNGMAVEFRYWGEHEVLERLALTRNHGRALFWFNLNLFNQDWFEARMQEALADAGPRYTPELNVELPIARVFEGLDRSPSFFEQIRTLNGDVEKRFHKATQSVGRIGTPNVFAPIEGTLSKLLPILKASGQTEAGPIDFHVIDNLCGEAIEAAWKCVEGLREREKASDRQDPEARRASENLSSASYRLRELISSLRELASFSGSEEAEAANVGALLLVGEAGSGKTHLLCDVGQRRVSLGSPTVLLHGRKFVKSEPWSQIIQHLGLTCSREEFLGALEAAAQSVGRKALILIDAINEGEGKDTWADYLAGMLTLLQNYPWVSLGISARSSYEDLVIPDGLIPRRLIRVVHHGFSDKEYAAVKTFFDYFGLEFPNIPLIAPEFQNPLFLKLFCLGLRNEGLTKIPPGFSGLTAVFQFFLKSTNSKLAKPEHLDFDPRSSIIVQAVDRLIQIMVESGRTWAQRDEAVREVNQILPRPGHARSLFWHLLSEGVLIEDRVKAGQSGEWVEAIRFSYERFADYLIVKGLLDKHLDVSKPSSAFALGQPLHTFVQDESACWLNKGLLDALSIQVPERTGIDLVTCVPEVAEVRPVMEAFVDSLVWRDIAAFSRQTLEYVNSHIVSDPYVHERFLNALLTVAANPQHPYNADFLHRHLMRQEIADRDEWWSVFLHSQYGQRDAVDRLVDWAWSPLVKDHIDDEAIRLCAKVLAWFLASSNRFVRDRATKALESLLRERLPVLIRILTDFADVNDPYVQERLCAVAYGCAMRSSDTQGLEQLGRRVFEIFFRDKTPAPHVLLRDYARGTVECAIQRGVSLDIPVEAIRPPYQSDWPTDIPTKDELLAYRAWSKDMPDEEWARVHLYESVMGFEDFARYVLGADSPYFAWSSRPLHSPRVPTLEESFHTWEASLTRRQAVVWEQYRLAFRERLLSAFTRSLPEDGGSDRFPTPEQLEHHLSGAEERLRNALGKRKTRQFEEIVVPYLTKGGQQEDRLDVSILQRFILKRVLDLGWTVQRFGHFDRNMSYHFRYGRSPHKPERIGKKYQWIAYHEGLARISDNFEFRQSRYSGTPGKYEGPWQIGIRDIDPSFALAVEERRGNRIPPTVWWSPASHTNWEVDLPDEVWLRKGENLPPVTPLIEVIKPDDLSTWIVLDAFYNWEQTTVAGRERYEEPTREIWYMLKSYLVHAADLSELLDWATKQDFMGRWMPEPAESHGVFLGEFHWAPAYREFYTEAYPGDGWTNGDRDRLPKSVYVPVVEYAWGGQDYDCSIDESVQIRLPADLLVERLGLSWGGKEGRFFDGAGELVAFDPSVQGSGPGALLIRKDAFVRFLAESDLRVLWTVLGEKRIIGGPDHAHRLPFLVINGVYTMEDGEVKGAIRTHREQ